MSDHCNKCKYAAVCLAAGKKSFWKERFVELAVEP